MQTLASEIAITFVDDAAALLAGGGRIVIRILMAPVERVAHACDVAGVLSRRNSRPRNSPLRMQVAGMKRGLASNRRPPRSHQRRCRSRNCSFSFRFLRDLT
jgi:hypothetical protein